MDKKTMKLYFKQLGRMYSLLILIIFAMSAALIFPQFGLRCERPILIFVMVLTSFALFYFQPWKIMSALREGLEYKRQADIFAEELERRMKNT